MKSYTDLEQSKKLAEILPLESADMCYLSEESLVPKVIYNGMAFFNSEEERLINIIYCWSLAALLDNVLPKIVNNETLFIATSAALWHISYKNIYTAIDNNLIDACYEMIIKLHEQKLL